MDKKVGVADAIPTFFMITKLNLIVFIIETSDPHGGHWFQSKSRLT
ncbi:MAG: hypothetical protein LVT47_04430 [Cyanobacteria bacterium LVE1205-1]|jgi:hypothetical protein